MEIQNVPHSPLQATAKQTTTSIPSRYISLPCIAFLLQDLSTMGWYRSYWFCANWETIRKVEKHNISSFWRSVFAFLYVRSLFEYIANQAHAVGYKTIQPKRYAAIYVTLTLVQIILYANLTISYLVGFLKPTPESAANALNSLYIATFSSFILFPIKNIACWPIQKAINFYDDIKTEQELITNTRPINYLDVSPIRFVILNVLTIGLYRSYWNYKNWNAIKEAEQSDISPFWRTIFISYFTHALFKKIYFSARHHHYPRHVAHGNLATIYLVVFLLFSSIYRVYTVPAIGIFLPLVINYIVLRPILACIHFYKKQQL